MAIEETPDRPVPAIERQPETPDEAVRPIDRLLAVMAALRTPETGCPWDLEQTFRTIAPYTIEEAYEVADAIERGDLGDLKDELGDLLLQVVYHAQMASEVRAFSFDDVARSIADKMVERHPHVFGNVDAKTSDATSQLWEARKQREREMRASAAGERAKVLDGVAVALPGLTRAVKLQKRLARVGFDWSDPKNVFDKIDEEIGELRQAMGDRDGDHAKQDAVEDEFGDLLFVIANLARWLDVDPEAAIRRTNAKVERRFGWLEEQLAAEGRRPTDASLEELEALWQAAKPHVG